EPSRISRLQVTGSDHRASRFTRSASPSKFGVIVVGPSTDHRLGGVVSVLAVFVALAAAPLTMSVVRLPIAATIDRWKPVVIVSGSRTPWNWGFRCGTNGCSWCWLFGALFHIVPIVWSVVKIDRMSYTTPLVHESARTALAPALIQPEAKLSTRSR